MTKDQYDKFNKKSMLQITAAWTLCFLIGPLLGWAIGDALKNTPWAIVEGDTIIYLPLGLVIAQTMSGLLTALILRKTFSGLKFHHIILITIGWAITGLLSSYFVSATGLFSD